MSNFESRELGPGDELIVDSFLRQHAFKSMFLRSNLHTAGFLYKGGRYEGNYAGVFEGDSLVAVACHYWAERLVLQAPQQLEGVLRAVLELSERPVSAIIGPWQQAKAARAFLGLADAPTRSESRENLYALDLAVLEVPASLEGELRCEPGKPDLQELLTRWSVEYSVEELGAEPGEELDESEHESIEARIEEQTIWVVYRGDEPVAMASFNARLPDTVQLGGVYTPPEFRGKGYARAAVAGALLEAREAGVQKAVLFTDQGNDPAIQAYRALGFESVGEYGLITFAGDQVPKL